MSKNRKLPPGEAWKALEQMAFDDEAERILGLSDKELDDELARHGFDPAALRAEGAAYAEKLKREAGQRAAADRSADAADRSGKVVKLPVTVPPARRRPARVVWLAAAMLGAGVLTLVAMNGAAIVALFHHVEPIGPDIYDAGPPNWRDLRLAARLRDDAYAACDATLWQKCLDALDEAAKLDPAGDADPRVGAARELARSRIWSDSGPKDDKPKRH
jgi:hypothetical protein